MSTNPTLFKVDDMIEFKERFELMRNTFGGPFKVGRIESSDEHPQIVTIDMGSTMGKHRFAGYWFRLTQ